jgi:LysR family transcriptional regulator for bpeEF and oprC
VIARRVGAYELIAVAAPGYVEAYGVLSEPAELRLHSCILLRAMGHRPGHRDHPDPPHRHIVCPDIGLALAACRRGLGVAILPRALLETDLRAGALVSVLDAYNPLVVPLFAVYPERSHLRAVITAFIEFVSEHFEMSDRG